MWTQTYKTTHERRQLNEEHITNRAHDKQKNRQSNECTSVGRGGGVTGEITDRLFNVGITCGIIIMAC